MSVRVDGLPAILGGARLLSEPAGWPPESPAAQRYVIQALESRRLCGYAGNDAPLRTEAERVAARRAGYGYGVACGNGTRAIGIALQTELTLRGSGWWAGRDIIAAPTFTWVPGTFGGAAQGVLNVTGRRPKFILVDSRAEDWTIDEQALTSAMRMYSERLLGVVVPSLLDTRAALEVIVPEARRLGVPVIHDGAQCGGARHVKGELADWETRSLQIGKFEGGAVGDGAFVFTNNRTGAWVARRITDAGNMPGGALDHTNGNPPDISLGYIANAGNDRLSGLLGAAALGGMEDAQEWIATLRAMRRRIGCSIGAGATEVIFTTPPIQASYDTSGPTYGFGMSLTPQAEEAYGLNASQWQEIFAAEGFALPEGEVTPGYKYGIRRPYPLAHSGTYDLGETITFGDGHFPNAETIAQRGLMVHAGLLLDNRNPARLEAVIDRALRNIDGLRRHFNLA